ncbi:Fc.00g103590.m01.CDS01 [Cosmosporella sp. VM-42]
MAAPNGNEVISTLTLQSSHRLAPRISLHTFSFPNTLGLQRQIRPSQHVSLQFPPDLDSIAGSHNFNDQDRRLDFTPCYFEYDPFGDLRSFAFLAGNGRVTGLLGLPRPQGQLTAQLVDVGKGFSEEILENTTSLACIAGGTGIAPFLALASAPEWKQGAESASSNFTWSIRGDDFAIVEFFLDVGILQPKDWSSVYIFITSGEDVGNLPAGKPESWWQNRIRNLQDRFSGPLHFRLGRIDKEHVDTLVPLGGGSVFFCGSKSLEWQVKMWSLGAAVVHCTER